MNGAGDPNIRTFEVLCSNSLLLQQHKEFVWPFENGDSFSEETIFKTPEEFFLKLKHLRENESLYIKCFENQTYIKNKYFTKEWLREYILDFFKGTA